MRIGELSRRTGVSRRSLRYYEQHGLLTSHRTANGWREYDETAEHRARAIARMIGNGPTLEEVKRLEPCLDMADESDCTDPHLALTTYRSRLATLDHRLAKLHHHRDALTHQIALLTTQNPTANPPPR